MYLIIFTLASGNFYLFHMCLAHFLSFYLDMFYFV